VTHENVATATVSNSRTFSVALKEAGFGVERARIVDTSGRSGTPTRCQAATSSGTPAGRCSPRSIPEAEARQARVLTKDEARLM
jgi:hypothetical protein